MSWPRAAYTHPAVADYGRALRQWWALTAIAVFEMVGVVRGGPYRALLDGLLVVPVIWALGPAGWPWLRWRLRGCRKRLGLPPVPTPAGDWRLPAGMLAGFAVLLGGISAWWHTLDARVAAPWWWLNGMAMLLAVTLVGGELWLRWALRLERRHEQRSAATVPPYRSVRLLRAVEGRALRCYGMVPLEESGDVWRG